jgi:hypothetical protein
VLDQLAVPVFGQLRTPVFFNIGGCCWLKDMALAFGGCTTLTCWKPAFLLPP